MLACAGTYCFYTVYTEIRLLRMHIAPLWIASVNSPSCRTRLSSGSNHKSGKFLKPYLQGFQTLTGRPPVVQASGTSGSKKPLSHRMYAAVRSLNLSITGTRMHSRTALDRGPMPERVWLCTWMYVHYYILWPVEVENKLLCRRQF